MYRIVDCNNLPIKLFMNDRNFDDLKRLLVMMQQTRKKFMCQFGLFLLAQSHIIANCIASWSCMFVYS